MSQTIIEKEDFIVTYDTINSILIFKYKYKETHISIPRCEFAIENNNIYAIYGDIKMLIAYQTNVHNIESSISKFKKIIYIRTNISNEYKLYHSNCHIDNSHFKMYLYNGIEKIHLEWDYVLHEYLLSKDRNTFYDIESFSLVPLKMVTRNE